MIRIICSYPTENAVLRPKGGYRDFYTYVTSRHALQVLGPEILEIQLFSKPLQLIFYHI